MCGICGFVGIEDKKLLKKMSDCIAYRGPDDEGQLSDSGIGLANRRLSIIDVGGGHQPMHSDDERYWLVYNGELYNFQELRVELEKRRRFSTHSDTEVILRAFEERGPDCVEKFNGMFAFAIWDRKKKELFLARDRLGIKPLYYWHDQEHFAFGSEIKCILHHPHVKRRLNGFAAHQMLNLSAIVSSDTMFNGIFKLMPGHALTFNAHHNTVHSRPYWQPRFNESPVGLLDASRRFKHVFEKAVKSQMVSEVPLGALLSGGLDSSSIVAAMTRVSEMPVKTFSMGFGGSNDELDDARIVSEALGTDHTEVIIDPLQAFQKYPELIWHLDQPKVNNVYSYFVYQKVRERVTVCLSGLGGDELFGGYVPRHRQIRVNQQYRDWTPKKIRQFLSSVSKGISESVDTSKHPAWNRAKKYLGFFQHADDGASFYLKVGGQLLDEKTLSQVYAKALQNQRESMIVKLFEPYFNEQNPQEDFLKAEIATSLPDDLLLTEDAMSMAHSLEVRVPFLDNGLLDLSLALPFSLKYNQGVGKVVLREALKEMLPRRVLEKPKAGFGPNLFEWYIRGVKPLAERVLDNPEICKRGLINKGYIQRILSKPDKAIFSRHYALIQSLVGLEIWHRMYMGERVLPTITL